jgi:hypothetical protein
LDAEAADVRPTLIEALGRFGLGLLNSGDRLEKELKIGRDAQLPDEYFVGLGYRAWAARGDTTKPYEDQTASPLGIDAREFERFVSSCNAHEAELVRRGYQLAVRERSLP